LFANQHVHRPPHARTHSTFLVAPVWGIIADAASSPYNILQITFLVSLVGQILVGYSHNANYIMIMVFLTALFNAPVKSLMDSMVLDNLKDQNLYGRLRLWGQLGFGIGSSAVGLLLSPSSSSSVMATSTSMTPNQQRSAALVSLVFTDAFLARWPQLKATVAWLERSWLNLTGYKLLFFVHAALSIPTWLFIQAFRRQDASNKSNIAAAAAAAATTTGTTSVPTTAKPAKVLGKEPTTSVGQGLQLLLQNPDALLFFFLVFCVGTSSGMIENFAYVRIREVGGTGRDMGLSRAVSSAAGAPMFWFSGTLTKRLGVDRVMVLSLVSYTVRFLLYASMPSPLWALPAEALRGLTFALFWTGSTIYAHKVSPDGLHATMIMFVNAMYGGLGQSLGAVLGGRLVDQVGTVRAFGLAAAADGVLAATVAAYFYLWNRKSVDTFRNPEPIQKKKTASATTKSLV
jgi:MFS family permease